MTPNASDLAIKAIGGPVSAETVTHGHLTAFFPAPRIMDVGGVEVEMEMVDVGPVIVDTRTSEVERLGSLIFDWPAWLQNAP